MPTQQWKRGIAGAALAAAVTCAGSGVAFGEEPAKVPSNVVTLTSKDTGKMDWDILDIPQINAKLPVKMLQSDPETGMTAILVKYEKGFMNTWHTHPTAHAMYVIEGTLVTHQGEFGPGSWVWFPEGGWMQHGATATSDVVVLFVTPKKFDIKYPVDKDPWYPMNK